MAVFLVAWELDMIVFGRGNQIERTLVMICLLELEWGLSCKDMLI